MENRINLLDPAVRANRLAVYAKLRQDHPVCQVDPGGMWAVSRYHDARYVLDHPELFSSRICSLVLRPSWLDATRNFMVGSRYWPACPHFRRRPNRLPKFNAASPRWRPVYKR
jgi:cytochrome P450